MKRIAILLVLTTAFFSCSDTTYYKPGVYRGSIVGRWKTVFSTRPNSIIIDTSDCNYRNEIGLYWTLQFENNGDFTIMDTCSGTLIESGTFMYYNGELILDLDGTTGNVFIDVQQRSSNRITMDYSRTNNNIAQGFNIILEK